MIPIIDDPYYRRWLWNPPLTINEKPRHPLWSHGLSLACPGLTAFLTRAVPRAQRGTRRRLVMGEMVVVPGISALAFPEIAKMEKVGILIHGIS